MMNRKEIKYWIIKKLQDDLQIKEDISELLYLGTLGLDSLKIIFLIVELEASFNITFSDEELLYENFSSLDNIVERISGKLL